MSHRKKSISIPGGAFPTAHRSQAPHAMPGTVAVQTYRSGPLPPAEEMERYAACVPNGAERIFAMAEAQSSTRLRLETSIVETKNALLRRGQIFGFILGLVGIISGAAVIVMGHSVAGSLLSGSSLISLVALFLYADRKKASTP